MTLTDQRAVEQNFRAAQQVLPLLGASGSGLQAAENQRLCGARNYPQSECKGNTRLFYPYAHTLAARVHNESDEISFATSSRYTELRLQRLAA